MFFLFLFCLFVGLVFYSTIDIKISVLLFTRVPFIPLCVCVCVLFVYLCRSPCRPPSHPARLNEKRKQGMWLATREQLRYLERKCRYLRYTDKSALGFVEKFSGSIEMFSSGCQTTKARIDDRTGRLGEGKGVGGGGGGGGVARPIVYGSSFRLIDAVNSHVTVFFFFVACCFSPC